jgi:phenylacetate-coenzyme A ligase PaaK-like adenylate-forming protein
MRIIEINRPLAEIVAQLNAHRPELLVGYTAHLAALAAEQRAGRLGLSLLSVVCTGEALPPPEREAIEQGFGAPAVSLYGSSEHLQMGLSPPDGRCLVLYDDDLIYEIREEDILVTNLFNRTMPLIRYLMADVLRPLPRRRAAPPYLEIEITAGRGDLPRPRFETRDGGEASLNPNALFATFIPGLIRLQMQILGRASFRLCAWPMPGLGAGRLETALEELHRRVRAMLDANHMDNVVFEIAPTEELSLDAGTRKFPRIVDLRPKS